MKNRVPIYPSKEDSQSITEYVSGSKETYFENKTGHTLSVHTKKVLHPVTGNLEDIIVLEKHDDQ